MPNLIATNVQGHTITMPITTAADGTNITNYPFEKNVPVNQRPKRMLDFKQKANALSPNPVVKNGTAPPIPFSKLILYSLIILLGCLFMKNDMSVIDSLGHAGSRGTTIFGAHKIGLMMVLLGIKSALHEWLGIQYNMDDDGDDDDDDDDDDDIMQDWWRNWLYYFLLFDTFIAHTVRCVLLAPINTILCNFGEAFSACIEAQVYYSTSIFYGLTHQARFSAWSYKFIKSDSQRAHWINVETRVLDAWDDGHRAGGRLRHPHDRIIFEMIFEKNSNLRKEMAFMNRLCSQVRALDRYKSMDDREELKQLYVINDRLTGAGALFSGRTTIFNQFQPTVFTDSSGTTVSS
jgi:hypothetical protein